MCDHRPDLRRLAPSYSGFGRVLATALRWYDVWLAVDWSNTDQALWAGQYFSAWPIKRERLQMPEVNQDGGSRICTGLTPRIGLGSHQRETWGATSYHRKEPEIWRAESRKHPGSRWRTWRTSTLKLFSISQSGLVKAQMGESPLDH